MAFLVHEEVDAGAIEIDPLEVAEVDRVGRGRPDTAEKVGIGRLQPETAPTSGGMAGDEARRWLTQPAKSGFEGGDEFLD